MALSGFFPNEGSITMDTVDPLTMQPMGRRSVPTYTLDSGGFNAPVVDRMTQGMVQDNLGRSTILSPGNLSVNPSMPDLTNEKALSDVERQTNFLQNEAGQYRQEKLALAGAKFGMDILNANLQYRQIAGQAAFNIQMAKNQAADSLFRGRQAASQAQSQGRAAGDQAILAMAAQGQDVSGAGVGRVVGSYEAVAEQNAMQLEINGIKEALGFQLEEVNYNFQVQNAKINRDATILSSALNLGAQAYGLGAM